MDIDKTTFNDLNIFHQEEEFSIFHKLNFTRTRGGKDWLARFFSEPFNDIKRISDTQDILKSIQNKAPDWPVSINNGTIMVIEKFYESMLDTIPDAATTLNAYSYRVLHAPDFSLLRYSVGHFADFVRGCRDLVNLFDEESAPKLMRTYLNRISDIIKLPLLAELASIAQGAKITPLQTIYFGNFLRYRFKAHALELIEIYGRFDAWYSMAIATTRFNLCFPSFSEDEQPFVEVNSLYHILLPLPVSYNVKLAQDNNFIFLTGANMAGKSTFIKAVGACVYLAHLGMGVPALQMRLTLFNGILSNINVVDNIIKGESYFFNEVQRIKNTILKINDGKKWLVLIDELFKGTNVQDAMKCSSTVIKGLIKIKNSLFILSTHLYEIGDELKSYPNISFRFFETNVKDDQLDFSYQLKEGISNDRLGYLILRKEKVVELLEQL
jgi:DNA mismatch repair ATPase MutS